MDAAPAREVFPSMPANPNLAAMVGWWKVVKGDQTWWYYGAFLVDTLDTHTHTDKIHKIHKINKMRRTPKILVGYVIPYLHSQDTCMERRASLPTWHYQDTSELCLKAIFYDSVHKHTLQNSTQIGIVWNSLARSGKLSGKDLLCTMYLLRWRWRCIYSGPIFWANAQRLPVTACF